MAPYGFNAKGCPVPNCTYIHPNNDGWEEAEVDWATIKKKELAPEGQPTVTRWNVDGKTGSGSQANFTANESTVGAAKAAKAPVPAALEAAREQRRTSN